MLGSLFESAGDPAGISAYAGQRDVATVCEHARLSVSVRDSGVKPCGVFTGRPCSDTAAERSNGSSDRKCSNASSANIQRSCHTSPEQLLSSSAASMRGHRRRIIFSATGGGLVNAKGCQVVFDVGETVVIFANALQTDHLHVIVWQHDGCLFSER